MERVTFEKGAYGPRAVLCGPWSESVAQEIERRGCAELEINYAKGWVGEDVEFLRDLRELRALTIIDFNLKSVDAVHDLGELRALELTTYCKTPIDFSAFPRLCLCVFEWRPRSESLFGALSLKELFINRYKGRDTAPFGRLDQLESLGILNAPVRSLRGLAGLARLRRLRLARLVNLESLDGLQCLTALEDLEISTCRKVGSVEQLRPLANLRRLCLNNDGKLASLLPIDGLEKLESVSFNENTNIVDGDLSPLVKRSRLEAVAFQNRKHYSHRREELAPRGG